MNKIPCEDCITFAVCRNKYVIINESKKTFIRSSILTCPLFNKSYILSLNHFMRRLIKLYEVDDLSTSLAHCLMLKWKKQGNDDE